MEMPMVNRTNRKSLFIGGRSAASPAARTRGGLARRWVLTGLVVMAAGGTAVAQLTPADIEALRLEGKEKGWTFTVGENPATQYSLDELCGLVMPEDWRDGALFDPCTPTRAERDSWDWRALGGVTPVKNQGGCGSCWAFSTVGALECNIKIIDGFTVDLSEQWLLSCNHSGWDCDGGWYAHDYHQWDSDVCGQYGAAMEAEFPYVAYEASCLCPYAHPYVLDSWAYIGGGSGVPSVSSMKQAILDYGPISVGVYANSAMHAYTGGIFNDCDQSQGTNHAVVLVGWDDNQGSDGVWFMRNSWGIGWGEDGGYMRMPYGCSLIGTAANYVVYGGGLPPLEISFPDGLPESLSPGESTLITVEIGEMADTYVWGTVRMFHRYFEGAWTSSIPTHLGGDLFQATLPPAWCGATPEFYFTAEGDTSGVIYEPSDAPDTVYTAALGEMVDIFADDFETNQGWTVENLGATSGDWQRGVPVDDSGWDYDPASDSDGSGKCYLTQNEDGNTDVDDGAVRLTSPLLDLSGGDISISYDYFLRLTNEDGEDRLLVEISGNGDAGPWIEIARHDTNGGLDWRNHVISQNDLDAAGATLTSTMKIRFTTNDADEQSINESGLDAFVISGFDCVCPRSDDCADAPVVIDGTCTGSTTDATNDGSPSCGDSSTTADVWYAYTAHATGDLQVDTCGSSYNTVLSLHSSCPGTSANELACNDDSCGLQSEISYAISGGETVFIRVSGYDGETGSYELNITGPVVTPSPSPDPMAFSTPPYADGVSSISMVATTAYDNDWPPVSYYFDSTASTPGGTDSGWQEEDTVYTDTDLLPNYVYAYNVMARDTLFNETVPSGDFAVATWIQAPTSQPRILPGDIGVTTMHMVCIDSLNNLDVGLSGLYFDCIDGAGDTGINEWLTGGALDDTATGLTPNTEYTFRVKARNQDGVESDSVSWSPTNTKYTRAEVPAAPVLSNETSYSMDVAPGADGNPSYTLYAIYCSATAPPDANWNGMYLDAAGNPSADAVYQTQTAWGTTTAVGMAGGTTYTFEAHAQNAEGRLTDPGPSASLTTTGVAYLCTNGALDPGEDRIDCGGVCPPCDCLSDGACANGQYCDGVETCDDWGHCQDGSDVNCNDGVDCTVDSCNEDTDQCDNVPEDAYCDNDLWCDGVETCDGELGCQDGSDPCPGTHWCEESTDSCIAYGNGDFEPDGDVDLEDFHWFQQCFGEVADGACEPGNLTGSGVIGLDDLEQFVDQLNGPQ